MNITGYIGTKSTQMFAYADDVAIVSRNKNALKDTVINLESEARRRGLLINENKTKYMEVTRTVVNGEHLHCEKHEFEHVKEFSYLGLQINQTNSINSEIQARILSGNRRYCAYGKVIKSRALNRSSKLKIYKSLIRPVVIYGCEAWTLTNRDEQNLRIYFYFIHDNKYYTNKKGMAMASPLSGTMAEIFLQHYEKLYLKHLLEEQAIAYYARYVDDILIIFDSSKITISEI
jgi:hypothetical protein